MTLWKINCMENGYPGMWQIWFRNQFVAVGWPRESGYPMLGPITARHHAQAWSRARSSLSRIKHGDHIIVSLRGNRVGRLGEVTGKAVEDNEWEALVPKSKDYPNGEQGRRIFVRWELATGPEDRDEIVLLPQGKRFTGGELRPTIAEINSRSLKELRKVMNDPTNWESLFARFDYESALSGYIATYPHHLEDGLTVHPTLKVRELTFINRSRCDIILLDRHNYTVVVECKQGRPTVSDVRQLRRYIALLGREKGINARGILVHGGSKKLDDEVVRAASASRRIDVVHHRLVVDFTRCI